MGQNIEFSHFDDPDSWALPPVRAVRFTGNIAQFLSDQRNVDDLNAVLAGEAIIIRLNPKAT